MRVLYMNQGGGGNHGAIDYASYDLILLAERDDNPYPQVFDEAFVSNDSAPAMSVWKKKGLGRALTESTDIDHTKSSTRPLVHTQATRTIAGMFVHIIFVHLKSASATRAKAEMEVIIPVLRKLVGLGHQVLLIGDMNRLSQDLLATEGMVPILLGGGHAKWDLDHAWANEALATYIGAQAKVDIAATAALDHGHIAISIDFCP
ncbi:MAG: hypothetical protein AAF608_01850 [Pseudomonadota bacterium]